MLPQVWPGELKLKLSESEVMDCAAAKELLSAYYDGELSSDVRVEVAKHLASCVECAQELEGFRNLSGLAEGLAQPSAPAHLWQRIEVQLDDDRRQQKRGSFDGARRPVVQLAFATAAAILLAIGWFGFRAWHDHSHDHEMAIVFGKYLEEFNRDPNEAQQILLANYPGRAVDAAEAVRTVGYRPAAAGGMPAGYSVESTYVMKMPCCTCVQCVCKRRDGSMLAIFEHDDADPAWFGGRPKSEAICEGKQCSIVDLGHRLAATWRQGKRHMTIVGAQDTAEIATLVAWFEGGQQTLPR